MSSREQFITNVKTDINNTVARSIVALACDETHGYEGMKDENGLIDGVDPSDKAILHACRILDEIANAYRASIEVHNKMERKLKWKKRIQSIVRIAKKIRKG